MDRVIVYPGGVPLDTDLLNTNRNAMVALGALASATLGPNTVVDGLAVVPAGPAALAVVVQPGSIATLAPLDTAGYGTLAADPLTNVVKLGVNTQPATFPLPAPAGSGTTIAYLIQAAFSESDANPAVLPYYNAANPAQAWLGPNNNGTAQPTLRTQRVALQLKAGAAAPAGQASPPPVDAGWIGLAVVRVNAGASGIGAGDIAPGATGRIPFKLPDLRPGFANAQVFPASGTFVVPPGVTRVKVTVVAGGGGGGTHATLPGGGGGAGGTAVLWIAGLVPGAAIPVTVGGGGQAPGLDAPGNGAPGGSSSFGTFCSATGGQGGAGGTGNTACAGGPGGFGFGGTFNQGGACGTDAIPIASRAGDGGGAGAGRGTTGLNTGFAGRAPGAGGGGGGAGTRADGSASGSQGGNGAAGIVVVEY